MSEAPNPPAPINHGLQRVIELNTAATQQEDNAFVSIESTYSPFQQYYEDQSKVDPKNKLKLLFAVAASGVVPDFTLADLTEGSFKYQPCMRMSKDVIKGEITRRDPTSKFLVKHTISDLMQMLSDITPKLTDNCKKFIVTTFGEVKKQFDKAAQ